MAAIGLPLLADGLYGGAGSPDIHRQALHAFSLAFVHPFSAESLHFQVTLPADMQAALAGMGLHYPLS
jgi:23S rRNA pseudouridine1911/1915/1917 synthase